MRLKLFVAAILLTGLLTGAVQAQSFTEVGASAGVNDAGEGTGMAWGDYDNDGDLDIYVANSSINPNRLYQNNGGTFTEVGAAAGVNYSGAPDAVGVTWGDYDNDGDLDLYVVVSGAANLLYRNNGNGTFTEVGASAGVNDTGPGTAAGWADYDKDGDLDLYVANGGAANLLYRNNGNGTFTEVGASAGVNASGNSVNLAWGDYDGDGDVDLYISRATGNLLYKNNNDGTFAEVSISLGVNESAGSPAGVAWQDYDNDGDLDLYAVRNASAARLYRNNGNGTFTEVGASAGVNINSLASHGPAWGDYDNDGDADLYLGMHRSPNLFYKNNGDGTFTEVASSEGVNDSGGARAVSWGDYDNDGDLDLYVVNDHPSSGIINRLFRNNGNSNRWLVVKLVGTASNKNGIGARVTAVTGSTRQRRDVDGGSGYWSEPSLPVEFGFGGTTTVDSLIVRWPSGTVQALTNVATNQVLTVKEPGPDLQIRGKIVSQSASNSTSEIWSMNPDGTEKQQLTSNSVYDAEPVLSPDGTKIVFHRDTSGNRDVWVMNADGSSQTNLTDNAAWDSSPSWSPDGRKIVFSSTRADSKSDIYIMDSDGTNLVRVTDGTAGESQARWSPDGVAIAYNRAPAGGNWGLWKMNADGTAQMELDGATSDNPKAWSPDGTKILYARGNNLYTMNADGTNQQSVVPGVSGIGAWSPEGGKFVYHDGSNLYVKNRDGTAADGFTPISGFYGASDWQPFRHIGSAGVGASASRVMTIDNKGATTLTVSNITSSDGQFAISPINFSVNPGSSQNVTVTFIPTSAGTKYSTLTIGSNDPDTPSAVLKINGKAIQFTDVSLSAGVNDAGNGVGMAWGDYDSDGDQDIYVANYAAANVLYRNNGNGTFAEVGASAGVNDANRGRGAAWGDYDSDGDLDLYLANDNAANRLYRNDGNGTFTEVGASAGVNTNSISIGTSWGDYDADGDLDLFVATSTTNLLYRNNGNGTFTDVAASAGVNNSGNGQQGAWGDYDGDNDLDLYVSNSGSANLLYRNNGNGTFTSVGASAGVNNNGNGQGVSWGDYDNDGDLDLYVSNSGSANLLYRNNGNGTFAEVGASAGVNDSGNGQSTGWADYDNDGDLDLYLANYENANRLYKNNGNGTFTEVGASEGVDVNVKSQGAAWGDYDGDGDLDIYLALTGANRLYRNNGNANRWLVVKLVGTANNKSGIGAQVTAFTGATRQRRDVDGGSGIWSQPSLPVEFGFGNTTTVDSVVVRWPNGAKSIQTNVATNQMLTIGEPPDLQVRGKIVFETNRDGNFEVYSMDADGTNQTRLTNNTAYDGAPAWSPDGSRIAFSSARDGNRELYVMNAGGTNQTRLTNNSADDNAPAWSPDGSKILFHSARDGNYEIYVMNADGTNPVNRTNNAADDDNPKWSPDGTKILFTSSRVGAVFGVWKMDANGTNPTQLTSGTSDAPMWWSPEGSKISFTNASAGSEAYIMNSDGTGQTNLTNHGAGDATGAFSPEGSRVAFSTDRDGNAEVYSMLKDGSGSTRLTSSGGADQWIDWVPFRHIGPAGVGSSVSRVMTIDNKGASTLTVSNITSSDGQFTISPTSFSVNTSSSQNVTVTFTPTTAGVKYATLTITSNDPDAPSARLTVNGGMELPPTTVLLKANDPVPSSLTFRGSGSQAVTVSDSGTANLSVTPTITGTDVAQFSVNPNAATTVVPGAAQSFTVNFNASSLTGNHRTATLNLAHNATNKSTPLTVALTGDVLPNTPSGLAATTGNGQATLNWTANTESDLSHYVIYRSTANNFTPVAADSIGRVNKPATTFTSTGLSAGTHYFKIAAVDSANNKSSASLQAQANIIILVKTNDPNPSTLRFMGSGSLNVSVADSGNTSLNVTPSITGTDAGQFSVSPGVATIVAPGATQNFTVTFNPSPTTGNNRSATLNLAHNATNKGIPLTVSLVGDVPPNAPTNLAANAGNNRAVLTWSANSENDLSYYVVYRSTTNNFTPTAADSVGRVSKPTSTFTNTGLRGGIYYFKLAAVDSVGNKSAFSTQDSAMVEPHISVSPAALSFGNVRTGTTRTQTFTVANVGTDTLNVSSMSLSGPDAARFSFSPTAFTVAPGAVSQAVSVIFSPTVGSQSATPKSAVLTFADNAPENPQTSLSGTATAAVITVSPASLYFENVSIGQIRNQQVTVSNTGTDTLFINTASISGVDASQFPLVIAQVIPLYIIPPGGNQTINIPFVPTNLGNKTATLILSHNAAPVATSTPITLSSSTDPPPLTPATPTATAGDGQVVLNWPANTEADLSHYVVYRSTTSNFTPSAADSIGRINKPTTTYTGTGLNPGTYYFKLAATDVANNKSSASAQATVNLTRQMDLSVTALSFESVAVGLLKTQSLWLRNSGNMTLRVSSLADNSDQFSFTPAVPPSRSIAPRDSVSVTVTFSPTSLGNKTGTLTVTSDATNTPTATVGLSGNGTQVEEIRIYGSAGNKLVIINAAANTVVGTISTPAGAGYNDVGTLTLAPDLRTAYGVTGESASGVVVFDVTTTTFGRWYPIPGNRRLTQVGVTPDQRILFVVDQDGLVHVVEVASGNIVKQINIPSRSFDGVMSKDGAKLYLPHRDAGTISVINTTSRSIVKTISVPAGPNNIAISPDGARAYVTHESARVVSCLDLSSDTVLKTVSVQNAPIPIVVSSDGRTVYVGNRDSNSISVIDVANWTVVKTVSNALPGGNVHTLGFANNRLYATGSTVSVVAVYDARVPSALSLLTTVAVPVPIGGTELLAVGVKPPPTITDIANQVVNPGVSTGALPFTVGDAETAAASLTVSGTSSNPVLVPSGNIVFGGSGANRTVTVTPVANQVGNATITVTVTNRGGLTASDAFTLTINTPPTITDIANQVVNPGVSTGPLSFTVGDVETAAASLTVMGSSSNTTLVPNANVVFGDSGANRTVTVTPASNQTGVITITVTVTDEGGLTASDTFTVTIDPIGAKVYGSAGNKLIVINAATNTVVGTVSIPTGVGYSDVGTLTLAPDLRTAYGVTGESASGVVAFDVATNTFGRWYPIPSNRRLTQVGITPDQRTLFVVDQDGLVHVVAIASGRVVRQIRVPSRSFDGVMSKDGAKLYLPHRDAGTISVINTTSRSIVKTISVPAGPNNIAISPDGARAYVTHESARVVTCLDLTTDTVLKTVSVQNAPIPIVVSSDGRTVYVGNRDSNSISVIDVASWMVIKTVANALPGGNVHTLGFANNQLYATGSTVSVVAVYDARIPSALSLLTTVAVPVPIGGTELLAVGDTVATNTTPTITNIVDPPAVSPGVLIGPLPFTVGDVETPAASLTVTGTSSNTILVPNGNIVFGGSGASRTVMVTPAVNQVGSATITVTVTDEEGLTNSKAFTITVDRRLLGDVNGDGQVDSGDAILVLRHSAGLTTLTDSQKDLGDVNGDRSTDSGDAILILRYSAGIITRFPRGGTAKPVLHPVGAGLRLGEVRTVGEGFVVPLIIETGVSGADLSLRYDGAAYRLAGVERPEGVLLASNFQTAGELRLAVARLDAGEPVALLVHLEGPVQALALELRGKVFGAEGEMLAPVESRLERPLSWSLSAYPNPFNASTTLRYDVAKAGEVRLMIYDVSGAIVRHLVSGWQAAGQYSLVWDGRDEQGRVVASGLYLSALEIGSLRRVHKLMLLK